MCGESSHLLVVQGKSNPQPGLQVNRIVNRGCHHFPPDLQVVKTTLLFYSSWQMAGRCPGRDGKLNFRLECWHWLSVYVCRRCAQPQTRWDGGLGARSDPSAVLRPHPSPHPNRVWGGISGGIPPWTPINPGPGVTEGFIMRNGRLHKIMKIFTRHCVLHMPYMLKHDG